jgi:hypothetical protein
MSTRTIRWTCQIEGNWEWLSAARGNRSFPQPKHISGTITLEPNEEYVYPCITVIKQGKYAGNGMLRYFLRNGIDMVQAIVVAQGSGLHEGPEDREQSTATYDGLTLTAVLA